MHSGNEAKPGSTPPGPWGSQAPKEPPRGFRFFVQKTRSRFVRVAFYALFISLTGAAIYKDLSRPEAWAYWKDLYFSPSLKASLIPNGLPGSSGDGRPALAISGTIGAAAAGWFRDRLDEAHLKAGDSVVLSSPGGDLNQALIIGAVLRSRGLVTAVGTFDASGRLRPSYCASACVIAYAGGQVRLDVPGSLLGVHRFTSSGIERDPVADTQRTAGIILNYMTRMGVSPSILEAMSATSEVHWLSDQEARGMRLVTAPLHGS
jgi:hypothetical protein